MTFSTLLNRGSSSVLPGHRMDMSGPSGMGDGLPYIERGMDRGTYGYGGNGGDKSKGGSKGNQTAMSALTLLAFLFFINMLQSCLKEMSTTDETTIMIVSNATASLIKPRPKREVQEKQEIVASPGAGFYWDSNSLVQRKGDVEDDYDLESHTTTDPGDELQEEYEEDYDYPDVAEISSEPEQSYISSTMNRNVHRQELLEEGEHSQENIKTVDDHQGQNEVDDDYDEQSEFRTDNSGQFDSGMFYQGSSSDDRLGQHNIQQHTDQVMHFSGFTWLTNNVISGIASSMEIGNCYELVVCEVHRVSRHWGEPGILVASGLSEAFLWFYGADEGRRKAVLEAAENGRDHRNCGIHIQQCQDRSKDRSLLPFLATFVERFL